MWNLDTWVLDVNGQTIKEQLLDEGYTTRIVFDGASAYTTNGNPPFFSNGVAEEKVSRAIEMVLGA